MQKANPLIRTKIHLPFTRPELVPRPRLQEQILQGLSGPLTLITAPAGFGKTTLVAASAAGCGIPVAWLSLDKNDNLVLRFLSYLVAALQEADPMLGVEAAQLADASQQASHEAVLTSLINDLDAAGREIALVLDDYQFISSQAVHEAVAFLLEHCPNTFHLVIATRSDPPLPLARLRARGQTVELRAADLRFTQAEAAQFLNEVMGLHLDGGSITILAERTEGWIAGLQMAALSMRDRADVLGFIESFSGTNRHILDYLLEEVLAREPEEVQAFLLQTAILTRLTGPLCDAVTGLSGSQEMLERLERRNLFVVPLDDERRWYRYHHLFADLLQARLYHSGSDPAAQLFSRAAEWCEREGLPAEAVSYALAAKDHAKAVDLITKYWGPLANTGEVETVWSWLEALPEDVIRNSAQLSVAYCWMLWLRGHVGAIEAHLPDAEHAVSNITSSGGTGIIIEEGLPAFLAVLRSIVARFHDDCENAIALSEHALSLLPENFPPQVDAILRTLIYLAQASAYDGAGDLGKAAEAYIETIRYSRLAANPAGLTGMTYRMLGILEPLGRLRAADTACRDALEYIHAQGMARLPAAGLLHVAMSEVLVEQNELDAAETHLAQGMQLGKWSGRLDAVKNGAFALSRLRQARQDVNGAMAAVQEAETALEDPPSPLAIAGLMALKARILVRQRSLSEAALCIKEAKRLAGRDRGQVRQLIDLADCRMQIAQCKAEEAVDLLSHFLAAAEEAGRHGVVIELRILRSLEYVRQGAPRQAEADLECALALAEPEGYVRIFLDEGERMQMLLAQWLAHAGSSPLQDYALRLLSHFEDEPKAGPAAQGKTQPTGGLVEPLSQRELEVLQLIALGKTNQEIARQLIVSPGTGKAHTASIYRKLDVANRTEAVARARQLNILS